MMRNEVLRQSDLLEQYGEWSLTVADREYDTPDELVEMLRSAIQWQRQLEASSRRVQAHFQDVIDKLAPPQRGWRAWWPFKRRK